MGIFNPMSAPTRLAERRGGNAQTCTASLPPGARRGADAFVEPVAPEDPAKRLACGLEVVPHAPAPLVMPGIP